MHRIVLTWRSIVRFFLTISCSIIDPFFQFGRFFFQRMENSIQANPIDWRRHADWYELQSGNTCLVQSNPLIVTPRFATKCFGQNQAAQRLFEQLRIIIVDINWCTTASDKQVWFVHGFEPDFWRDVLHRSAENWQAAQIHCLENVFWQTAAVGTNQAGKRCLLSFIAWIVKEPPMKNKFEEECRFRYQAV